MGTANIMDVRVAGDTKSLVAEMRAVEKENDRLTTKMTKLAKRGKKTGKTLSFSYDTAKKKAAQFARELQNLEAKINKQGRATAADTKRLKQLNKALGMTRQRMRGLDSATRGAGRSLATGTGNALKFVGALAGIGGAAGAIMLIASRLKQEYQHLVDQQQRAKIAQMTVGEARAFALVNRPQGMSPKDLDKLVKDVSTRKGYEMPAARVWQLSAGMLSGKGGLDKKQYEAAFREGARLGSIAGEGLDITAYGGAIADVMKQTGGKDARAAGGLLMQFGTASRVVDPAKQAAALIKTMSAGPAFGFKQEEAAELTAAISQLSGDVEGATSATSVNRLMQTVTKMRSTGVSTGKRKIKLTKRGMAGFTELQDIFQTLSQDEQDALLSNMQLGKAGSRGAIMQLIRRTQPAKKAMSAAQKEITAYGPGTAKTWEGYFDAVKTGPHEVVRGMHRKRKSTVETLKLKNIKGAIASELREGMAEIFENVEGLSKTKIAFDKINQEIRSGIGTKDTDAIFDAAIKRVDQLRKDKAFGHKYISGGRPGSWTRAAEPGGYGVEKLPEGAWERPEKSKGRKVWQTGSKYKPTEVFLENTNYDPVHKETFDEYRELLKEQKELVKQQLELLKAQQAADNPQSVKIVSDERTPVINPNAQIESD